MEFHKILRALREDREPKLTQLDVAIAIHATQRKVSRLETGEAEPSLQDLRLLCRFYRVSADYLLGLPPDMPYPKR